MRERPTAKLGKAYQYGEVMLKLNMNNSSVIIFKFMGEYFMIMKLEKIQIIYHFIGLQIKPSLMKISWSALVLGRQQRRPIHQ